MAEIPSAVTRADWNLCVDGGGTHPATVLAISTGHSGGTHPVAKTGDTNVADISACVEVGDANVRVDSGGRHSAVPARVKPTAGKHMIPPFALSSAAKPVDTTKSSSNLCGEEGSIAVKPDDENGEPVPKKLKACISLDFLVGQQVDVLRTNNTWSTGYINSIRGGAQPHLIVRLTNRDWKRVLIREIDAKIRPCPGSMLLEEFFTPAGAELDAEQAFANNDDELSDTDCLQACAQYMVGQLHTTAPCNHVH